MTKPEAEPSNPLAVPLSRDARQKAIDVLSEAFARDDLDVEEFEQRVELVEMAKSMEHLKTILADLPPPLAPRTTTAPGASALAKREEPKRPTIREDQIPGNSVIIGIMGGGQRTGAWIPAKENWAIGVMGGADLDFREAQLGAGVTEIRAFALMGGVTVIVPPDVRVECSGIGIMGAFEHTSKVTTNPDPDAPVIRVSGFALMGGVDVTVRYPGETARDARVRLRAERKEQKRLARGK